MLLGYARGKVGSLVFARLKGQQITRAYNPAPNDRKTNKQMTQRVKLPALVAFYQQNKNFFPFSYTNKPTQQSDYNAFVSANLKLADIPYYDKGNIAKGFPVIGPYQGTDGPVGEVVCSWGGLEDTADAPDNNSAVGVVTSIVIPSDYDFNKYPTLGYFSIAEFSEALIRANSNLQNGDMLTFYLVAYPAIRFGAVVDIDELSKPNIVASCQITLDVNSKDTTNDFALKFEGNGRANTLYLVANSAKYLCLASQKCVGISASTYDPTDFETLTYVNLAMSICCVVSRNTGIQQVSRSRFALNPIATTYYNNVNSSASLANAISSYGATGEALLENKANASAVGVLTSKTEPFADNEAGIANCVLELYPFNNVQSVTIDSLSDVTEPLTVKMFAEGETEPFATVDNVMLGRSIPVPAGFGLYSLQVVESTITTASTGNVTATYYK